MSQESPNAAAEEGGPAAQTGEGGGNRKTKKPRAGSLNLGNYTRLMEAFSLIYSTKTVWDEDSRRIVPVDALRLAFTSDSVKAWLNSPNRKMVMPEQLVFEPGQEFNDGRINMFNGLEVEPLACAAEDVAPMLDLLRHLCSGPDVSADDAEAIMHWVLRWQAVPLQRLGTKMQTAVVMHGPQGTGKNLYWDVWRDIYGSYGVTVGQTELEDKFNDWLSCKLAIVGDEVVSRQEMYHNKNRLKLVVTQEQKFPIRSPHQSTRWESNHANVVFLSNEIQPLALEERDRRYMVIYTPLAADPSLYERVRDFLADDGARKWLHYLQGYPLDDFEAHTKPLMTDAKRLLITAGYKPAQRFAGEWLQGFLPLPVQVCSAEQVYRAFRKWCDLTGERFPPQQEIFGRDLRRFSDEHARNGTDPPLESKVIKINSATGKRAMRCWIPAGVEVPSEYSSESDWASECVDHFERVLQSYYRAMSPSAREEE